MTETDRPPRRLAWAREIQSLSQTGLAYCATDYERQRYRRLMEIAAEMIEEHGGPPRELALESFLAQPGYATPKIDVRGAVVRESAILLVQERADGRWCMPGGWADVGELPSEAVRREVWEESGFQVLPRKVIGVYDANRGGEPMAFYHAYKVVFLCDIAGGEPRASDETADADFFEFSDLPPLSSNRTNERHLKEIQAHLTQKDRQTAFD